MAAAAFTPASDEEVSAAAAAVAGPSSLADDLGASSASDLQETQAEAMKLDKEMRKLQRDRKKLNSRIIRQKGSLDDLKARIVDLRKQSAPCTGIAFVTFNEQSSAHACRDMLKAATEPMRLPKSRQELHLRAEFAPHPDNVLWENLQIRGRERQLRSGIVWAIISLMMCVSTFAIVSVVNWASTTGLDACAPFWFKIGTMGWTTAVTIGNLPSPALLARDSHSHRAFPIHR